jgi:phage terminase small subunit
MALNPRQAKFCQEYANGATLADAYQRAGYDVDKETAHVNGSRLLRNALICSEVERIKGEVAARVVQRAEEWAPTKRAVIEELAKVGFVNVKQLLAPDGTPLPLKDLPDAVAASISSFSVSYSESPDEDGRFVRVRNIDVKFHSKMEALKQLAAQLGYLKEPNPGGNNTTNNIIVLQAMAGKVREMSDADLIGILESVPRPVEATGGSGG